MNSINYTKLATAIENKLIDNPFKLDSDDIRERRNYLKSIDAIPETLNYLDGVLELGRLDPHKIAASDGLELVELSENYDYFTIVLRDPETGHQWTNGIFGYNCYDVTDSDPEFKVLFDYDSPWYHESHAHQFAENEAIRFACELISQGQEPDKIAK